MIRLDLIAYGRRIRHTLVTIGQVNAALQIGVQRTHACTPARQSGWAIGPACAPALRGHHALAELFGALEVLRPWTTPSLLSTAADTWVMVRAISRSDLTGL